MPQAQAGSTIISSSQIAAGVIINSDINSSAAIDYSKLAALASASLLVGSASNVATVTAVSGDIAITNAGVTAISSGVVLNADINASAAIDYSKLAALTSANILVGNGSNVATVTAVTGDVAITNAGVTAIASGVVVDADVSASAAIAYSKLAALTSANLLIGSASNVATVTAVTGDVTISNAGVTAITAGVIVNADMADDAIGLAEMASGTDGNLITYDASGNPAAVATGSSGQVLTSTGAGSAPTMQTLTAAGVQLMWYVSGSTTSTTIVEIATNTFSTDDFAVGDVIEVLIVFNLDGSSNNAQAAVLNIEAGGTAGIGSMGCTSEHMSVYQFFIIQNPGTNTETYMKKINMNAAGSLQNVQGVNSISTGMTANWMATNFTMTLDGAVNATSGGTLHFRIYVYKRSTTV